MADTFPEVYRVVFGHNLRLLAAQADSRIAAFTDADFNFVGGEQNGTSFSEYQLGNSNPSEMADRFGELPDKQVKKSQRWGFFTPYDDGNNLGASLDRARSAAKDPTSKVLKAMRAGLRRLQDAVAYAAMIGKAGTGVNGATKIALPAAQKITAASGVDLATLLAAKEKFDAAEITGRRHIAMPAAQFTKLLGEQKLTSEDYQMVKALVKGEINEVLGFTFHRYEPVGTTGGNQQVVAWIEDAVAFRSRVLEEPGVWKRRDKRPYWYGYYQVEMAAVRVEDAGVIEIDAAP